MVLNWWLILTVKLVDQPYWPPGPADPGPVTVLGQPSNYDRYLLGRGDEQYQRKEWRMTRTWRKRWRQCVTLWHWWWLVNCCCTINQFYVVLPFNSISRYFFGGDVLVWHSGGILHYLTHIWCYIRWWWYVVSFRYITFDSDGDTWCWQCWYLLLYFVLVWAWYFTIWCPVEYWWYGHWYYDIWYIWYSHDSIVSHVTTDLL